eukprot:UC4_evm1s1418
MPEEEFAKYLVDFQSKKFDIRSGNRQARALIARRDDEEFLLTLIFPQSICDLWSSGLFVRQLCSLYSSMERDEDSEPFTLDTSITFEQIAVDEHNSLAVFSRADLDTCWEKIVCTTGRTGDRKRIRTLRLPINPDFAAGASNMPDSYSLKFIKISEEAVSTFKEFVVLPDGCEVDDEDLGYILSMSVVCVVMAFTSKMESFIFGTSISVRSKYGSSAKGLFGPLTNDGALSVNVGKCSTFMDVFSQLVHAVRDCKKCASYPFSLVGNRLGLSKLPVHFEFMHKWDVQQLTDPEIFFFP